MTESDPPQPEAAEESALKPESSQVASNTIMLPVPQPNTCKGNLGPGVALDCLVGGSSVLGMCKMASFCFGDLVGLTCLRSGIENVAEEVRL